MYILYILFINYIQQPPFFLVCLNPQLLPSIFLLFYCGTATFASKENLSFAIFPFLLFPIVDASVGSFQ